MTDWVTRAYSKNSTPVAIDEELLKEEVVILLQGKNVFDDQLYTYLKLPYGNLLKLRKSIQNKDNFLPSDFGTVIAAGKGSVPAELHSEMAVTYGLIEAPKPKMPKINTSQPSMWEDGE